MAISLESIFNYSRFKTLCLGQLDTVSVQCACTVSITLILAWDQDHVTVLAFWVYVQWP